jgi:hypothetical protein
LREGAPWAYVCVHGRARPVPAGEERIDDEMHEYYYVPASYYDDGSDDAYGGGGGGADPDAYNMDAYEAVEGEDAIRDDLGEQYYVPENGDLDGGDAVDPAEVGLLDGSTYPDNEDTGAPVPSGAL